MATNWDTMDTNMWWTDEASQSSPSTSPSTPLMEFDCDHDFSSEFLSTDGNLPLNSFPSPVVFNIDDYSNGSLFPANDDWLYDTSSNKANLQPLGDYDVSPADISSAWSPQLGRGEKLHTATPLSHRRQQDKSTKQRRASPVKSESTSPCDSSNTVVPSSGNSSESESETGSVSKGCRPKSRATRVQKRSCTSVDSPTTNKSRKVAVGHNETEKKYRNRLNEQFEMLLAALPYTQDETVTSKKALVLEKARLRIKALEKENAKRGRELNRLVEQVMQMRSMMVVPMAI